MSLPGYAVYAAAKGAVEVLTRYMAKELGPRGIRVNAVCPVLVATEGLLEALADPRSPAAGDPQAFLDGFAATHSALGRLPAGAQTRVGLLHEFNIYSESDQKAFDGPFGVVEIHGLLAPHPDLLRSGGGEHAA